MAPELMRLDSTVVKSCIAPPSDSGLLDDGIRVLSRLFAQSRARTGVKVTVSGSSQAIQEAGGWDILREKGRKGSVIPTADCIVETGFRTKP